MKSPSYLKCSNRFQNRNCKFTGKAIHDRSLTHPVSTTQPSNTDSLETPTQTSKALLLHSSLLSSCLALKIPAILAALNLCSLLSQLSQNTMVCLDSLSLHFGEEILNIPSGITVLYCLLTISWKHLFCSIL